MEQVNHERTPKKILVSGLGIRKTPISTPKNFTSRFLLLSNNQNCTPSPNSHKNCIVRNPFENQLHEKLRLPVISRYVKKYLTFSFIIAHFHLLN